MNNLSAKKHFFLVFLKIYVYNTLRQRGFFNIKEKRWKMDRIKIESLKNKLMETKVRLGMGLLGTATICSLSSCAKTEDNSSKLDNREIEVSTEVGNTLDKTEDVKKYFSKEDLKLLMYIGEDGLIKYNFATFRSDSQEEALGNEVIRSYPFKFVSKNNKVDFIDVHEYSKDENGEVVVYRSISNGIIPDRIYSLPDSNLVNYYVVIDLSSVNLPGTYNFFSAFSLEQLENLEIKFSDGSSDINASRKEELYDISNLKVVIVNGESFIIDNSKSIFINTIFYMENGKEVYYDPSIINPNKALKYEEVDNLDFREGNVKEAYEVSGVTSADKEENEVLSTISTDDIAVEDINVYLDAEQILKGYLTYEEVEQLERSLNDAIEKTATR